MSTVNQNTLISWIRREFHARRNKARDHEYIWDCPFCDPNGEHHDYTFNVKKQLGNCWRGHDPRCVNGHNLLTLVSFYYNVDTDKAKEIIDDKFNRGSTIPEMKRKLAVYQQELRTNIDTRQAKIEWGLPPDGQTIVRANTMGARNAYAWLTGVRQIPDQLAESLGCVWLDGRPSAGWRAYRNRLFFPVCTSGSYAWIAYNIGEVTRDRPKTKNPPGSILSNMLFLYDYYVNSEQPIILTEGIFDALRLLLYGYSATSLFGTSISSSQIQLLNRLPAREVVVCLDADASGASANQHLADRADKMVDRLISEYFYNVSIIKLPKDDPDDTELGLFRYLYKTRAHRRGIASRVSRLKSKLAAWQESNT